MTARLISILLTTIIVTGTGYIMFACTLPVTP